MTRQKRLRKKRRKGFSFVECIILMLILAITLWAIMRTALWSEQFGISTQGDIGAYMLASNWFEVFETLPPADVKSDFDAAKERVAAILRNPGEGKQTIRGFTVEAISLGTPDAVQSAGAREIQLTLHGPQKMPLVMVKTINAVSAETVSDNITP